MKLKPGLGDFIMSSDQQSEQTYSKAPLARMGLVSERVLRKTKRRVQLQTAVHHINTTVWFRYS